LLPPAALVAWAAVTFPPSWSSCDAKEVVSLHEPEAIYYHGGEVAEILRESVNRTMLIAHDGGVEKRSEKGCAFL